MRDTKTDPSRMPRREHAGVDESSHARLRAVAQAVMDREVYAMQLLMHLPQPAERAALTDELEAGLRLCCRAAVQALEMTGSVDARDDNDEASFARLRALAEAAGWRALLEHARNAVIALKLQELENATPSELDIKLVCEAERYVDTLLQDVGQVPASARRKT